MFWVFFEPSLPAKLSNYYFVLKNLMSGQWNFKFFENIFKCILYEKGVSFKNQQYYLFLDTTFPNILKLNIL